MNPLNNISSASDVLNNAMIRSIEIDVAFKPISRSLPVTLFGDNTACLILSSIKVSPMPAITKSNEVQIT